MPEKEIDLADQYPSRVDQMNRLMHNCDGFLRQHTRPIGVGKLDKSLRAPGDSLSLDDPFDLDIAATAMRVVTNEVRVPKDRGETWVGLLLRPCSHTQS